MRTTEDDAEDRALLARVGEGDRRAFDVLYTRHERRVYRYLLTLIPDPHAAEDVLVDVMTIVWRDAAKFAGGSRATTWILGIARHKALDLRRSKARSARDSALEDVEEPVSEAEGPQEFTHRTLEAAEVKRALAQLSPEHREVLQLAFFEELGYEEIASLLGIPENTVKTRVYYAKRQLKAHLT
jgi:RNA polymerase sigma-70 factor (ECF subfamily)